MRNLLPLVLVLSASGIAPPAEAQTPHSAGTLPPPWDGEVRVAEAAPGADRHTIHTYFTASPESPDGRYLLFYASGTRDGHRGNVVIRDRTTGKERVLARGVETEDAHRAAVQQWVSNGRRVAFHDYRDGEWMVVTVDVATGEERVHARGRQLGWGQPTSDLVPIYGKHWNPGPHRDLEILNLETGKIRKVLAADAVRAEYPKEVGGYFGDRPVSIFFPTLSPDLKRVFFKMATPAGGDFRSRQASDRELLVGYDLDEGRFLFIREKWGHPAWHPDSRTIINVPTVLIDSDTGRERAIPGMPPFPGSHPTIGPTGRFWATDTRLESFGGAEGHWGVAVGGMEGEGYRMLHRFDNSGGAETWRVSHPHPSFSHDGRRIYFNVSEGPWTRLYVAEVVGDDDRKTRR